MITLAAASFTVKTQNCLHIVHPKETKNPVVLKTIQNIQAISGQVIQAGVHLLTFNRFRHFETVIVHDCDFNLLPDYLKRLRDYIPRLAEVAHDPKRNLIFIGHTLGLISPTVLLIPDVGKIYYNQTIRASTIDVHTKGLNLVTTRWGIMNESKLKDPAYTQALQTMARTGVIYMLGPTTVYTSDEVILFGKLYQVTAQGITTIAKLPETASLKVLTAKQERKIDGITFHYAEEEDKSEDTKREELKHEQQISAVTTTKQSSSRLPNLVSR